MNKTIKTIFAFLVLVFLVSCTTQQMPVKQVSASAPVQQVVQAQSGSAVVEIKNFAFSPEELKVKSGTVVEWTNLDSVAHTVTSTSGPESFDSKILSKGQRYSFTFTKPGTYEYYCELHPGMNGKVVVE